jgi:hypothetical protein
VSGGEVADVEPNAGEPGDLRDLALGKESICDAPLVEHLDGARLQSACPRPRKLLIGTALDDRDVDAGQRQLTGQHQSRGTAAHDQHRRVTHSDIARWLALLAAPAPRVQ